MENIEQFFDEIESWTTYSMTVDSQSVDYITFWTAGNGIQIDWLFKRNKSVVYMDAIRDSVYFFAKDINYLEQLSKFYSLCPKKYIAHDKKPNAVKHSVFCY